MKNKNKKVIFLWLFCFVFILGIAAQNQLSTQWSRLHQYAGSWVSTINPQTDSIAPLPLLRMKCMAPYKCQSLFVEVQQLVNDQYKTVLVEMIACDSLTNTIFASGQNGEGVVFVGKGNFLSPQDWVMEDADLLGNKTMDVRFHFNSLTDVLVEGFDTSGNRLWGTRYIKRNPKDKNLGVQLVSVHDNMLENPYETLKQLNRLGFSYIETFVYADGTFYGMSPAVFKNMVALAGLRFEGSMTFYDLPTGEKWDEAILWWKKCIRDHKEAGVSYLSTSNHQLKTVKSKHELQRYCDYYNAIGKLCAENGLQFVYHNHADEFLDVEGETIYDFFIKNTNPQYVSFQVDLYWMHMGSADPVTYLQNYPDRFISWHVKDYQELGESGKIDFEHIFQFQKVSGLKYVVVEVEDYNYPPIYSVGLAWEFLYHHILNEN